MFLNAQKRKFRDFIADREGSFATIFGVSAMAAAFMAGMALDYSRLANVKSTVNGVLDSAVLAVGSEMLSGLDDEDEIERRFRDFFEANLGLHPGLAGRTEIERFSADPETGDVSATVRSDVEMAFVAIAGFDQVPVRAISEASFSDTPAEVTMMLDVTGSMGSGGKLQAMKNAASDAIDILIPKSNKGNVRIGLVPYSAGVNAGMYGERASIAGRACVTERPDHPFTDASFLTARVGSDSRAACPDSEIMPLSRNAGKLRSQIAGYGASGFTAGHLGVQWSYYMLSQNWKELWPEASQPADFGSSARKVAILMTDGEFNTYFQGVPVGINPGGTQGAASSAAAIATCEEMKRERDGKPGIVIYAVAFDAPGAAKDTLRACASEDSGSQTHFFDAEDETQLREAFRTIASNIKKLRLSR